MNKVVNINLGGYPFTIDEDAYAGLKAYLDVIHRHFRTSEGYEEITTDIEARLAELFQESLGNRPIVNQKDVQDAIAVMGTPEEFESEPGAGFSSGGGSGGQYRTGRRLFRDPEDSVIGGVCSGIAAYLGIADPVWVRLVFILITVSGGFGIPAYLILWAILPEAKTAGDRLAMRGEPINVSNIGRIIEEELRHISDKVSALSEELTGKKKAFSEAGGRGRDGLEQLIDFIGRLIRGLIYAVSRIWKPVLTLLLIFIGLVFFAMWVGATVGTVFGYPVFQQLFPGQAYAVALFIFNVVIVIGFVLLGVAFLLLRLFYGTRLTPGWRLGLGLFWFLNIVSLLFAGSLLGRQFQAEEEVSSVEVFSELEKDTLHLALNPVEFDYGPFNFDDELWIAEDAVWSRNLRLDIVRAEDGAFELEQRNESRGDNRQEARELAEAVVYDWRLSGPDLVLPSAFSVPEGEPWRIQGVNLTLRVPDGKYLAFDEKVHQLCRVIDLDDRHVTPRDHDHRGQVWQMTSSGLVCVSCRAEE